jgi:hypothetical protein
MMTRPAPARQAKWADARMGWTPVVSGKRQDSRFFGQLFLLQHRGLYGKFLLGYYRICRYTICGGAARDPGSPHRVLGNI